MNIEIKHLVVGDEAVLNHVAADVFDEAISSKLLTAYLAEANHHLIVALKDGEVVGQIRAVIHKHPDKADELYIDNLGVTPSLQRQGIATRLFSAMLELGKTLGCEDAWLATERDNEQAKRFYESYGVKPETIAFYLFKLL
jgi:ribosomal protein S18 acetylase RimI-like enzyme